TSIVIALFIAQAIVFTVKAHQGYYKTDPALRDQYKEMVAAMKEKDFGPDAAQVLTQIKSMPYEVLSQQLPQAVEQMKMQKNMPGFDQQLEANPDMARQFNMNYEIFNSFATLFEYLDGNNNQTEVEVVEAVAPEMSNTNN
ncbi:MAG: hypothetical protein K2H75_07810, partial [Muribaculaceae bacterium]|nr:hypothetical protein [Muribaculaceae bacterium]